ncbi:integrase [Rhizobium sp. SSA_523]|uniref:integrase n=1 Tax=Rhizobium sp. SSA_523 TaxID=2952477 RepID=UPI0020904126|nr:integrase [Rhizobium sp. SSA_523]MCO5732854.1 integrase [Rhizobium sp. SSA_523]WKC23529.1 integrase [Rhizobium sp. SSA_523]
MEEIQAEGLKWIKRASRRVPYWVADEADVKNGYTPKTVNLDRLRDQPDILVARCNLLQAEMMLWRAGFRREVMKFDGTIRSLLDIYQRDPESSYQRLKPGSLVPYNHYLQKIEDHVGPRRVDQIDGIDVLRWHKVWSDSGKHLAAAATCRAVLEAAIKHGILRRYPGCIELREILVTARGQLPKPRPREMVITAEEVIAARLAAHAAGRPSSALAYALAYETTLRLWDVIGQWWPLDRGGISDVINPGAETKWFGLRWENIDDGLVLRYRPSKTDGTTGKSIVYPLIKAPMVLEEMEHWPAEKRTGPVIVSEETGLPYINRVVTERWEADRKAAGISSKAWARDLRASGITEGRAAGVETDDAAKVAGHSSKRTTSSVYDRAAIEAAERFADARIKGRKGKAEGA